MNANHLSEKIEHVLVSAWFEMALAAPGAVAGRVETDPRTASDPYCQGALASLVTFADEQEEVRP